MKKTRVLHIITHLPIGGAQDNTLLTVEKLDKERYNVILACGPQGEWIKRAQNIPDLKIIFIKELIRKIHLFYDIVAIFKIYSIIKKERCTIVHTHSSKPGFSGRIAAKLAGVPVLIHTIHGFPFHDFMPKPVQIFYILVEKFLSRLSDCLITVSKLNMQKAVDMGISEKEKFLNIYSGICFKRFVKRRDKKSVKKELKISAKSSVVGMVGRLSEQKAPETLFYAIPEILKKHSNTIFLIVGDGEKKKSLIRLTDKLDIVNRVKFLGNRQDIPDLLSVMDVYVLPSLWEGLGRSLTEAMYFSIPVVASKVEGVPELVEHEKTGFLVQPKDSHALSRYVIQLLDNATLRKRMGQFAKQKVTVDFSADEMVSRIDKLYQKQLSNLIY